MLEHWARAEYFARRLAAILEKELKAFEDICDKSEAMGNGGGRPRCGARRSHDPKDDNAALMRTKTEELMKDDPKKWYDRHKDALKGQLARREDVLEAIAKEVSVPRCVLTARDVNGNIYLRSPAIKVNFPGLGPQLVLSHYDHVDIGWKDDPSVAIRELGFRRLTWNKLNKKLGGYEHLMKDENATERLYLDAYLESTLCFDKSFGEWFVFEFPVKDERKWWAKKTKRQQQKEMHEIQNRFLKGAILGATEGSADAAWNSST